MTLGPPWNFPTTPFNEALSKGDLLESRRHLRGLAVDQSLGLAKTLDSVASHLLMAESGVVLPLNPPGGSKAVQDISLNALAEMRAEQLALAWHTALDSGKRTRL